MKQVDYLKSEESDVRHCLLRRSCPFGMMCGTSASDDEPPLFPFVFEVQPGDLVWTDLYNEHRTFVIREGLFACVANLDKDDERPFALFGSGYSNGLPELYVDHGVSRSYYLRCLEKGRICSFSGKVLRRRLENLGVPMSHRVLSCALLNLSSASFAMTSILSQPLLCDRVSMMLVYLRELIGRSGENADVLNLGHAEIAYLVGSDRAAVTKTLHKLEDAGLVALGYKSLRLLDQLFVKVPTQSVTPVFHVPVAAE